MEIDGSLVRADGPPDIVGLWPLGTLEEVRLLSCFSHGQRNDLEPIASWLAGLPRLTTVAFSPCSSEWIAASVPMLSEHVDSIEVSVTEGRLSRRARDVLAERAWVHVDVRGCGISTVEDLGPLLRPGVTRSIGFDAVRSVDLDEVLIRIATLRPTGILCREAAERVLAGVFELERFPELMHLSLSRLDGRGQVPLLRCTPRLSRLQVLELDGYERWSDGQESLPESIQVMACSGELLEQMNSLRLRLPPKLEVLVVLDRPTQWTAAESILDGVRLRRLVVVGNHDLHQDVAWYLKSKHPHCTIVPGDGSGSSIDTRQDR